MRRLLLAVGLAVLAACGGTTKTETKYEQLPPQIVKLVPPQIDSFVAGKSVITTGDGVDLTATFENGTGAIDQGVGAVTSGTPVHVTPTATTTYQLTVTSTDGLRSFASVLIQVAAAPAAATVSVRPNVTVGDTVVASVEAQPGMTYAWSVTNAEVLAGQGTSTVAFLAGTIGSDQVSVTVTNAAGATTTAMATVAVTAAPGAPHITAPAFVKVSGAILASIPSQDGATYRWSIAGGTILAGGDTASVTASSSAAGSVHLTVAVTNAAGATATGAADVQVLADPADFTILIDHTYAGAGEELEASVVPVPGVTYSWSVGTPGSTDGTLLSGQGTSQIRFRFTSTLEGAEEIVYLTETNAAGGFNSKSGGLHLYNLLYRVTNANDAGPGSLRDAFAVVNSMGGDEVDIHYEGPSPLSFQSAIRVTGYGWIHGAGADALVFDGKNANRLFFIDGGNLELDGVGLQNGLAQGGDGGGNYVGGGGGAGMGGLIYLKSGTLTLRSVSLLNSTAKGGNGGAPAIAQDTELAGGGGGGSASVAGGSGTLAGDPGAGGLGAPLFPGEDGGAGGHTLGDVSLDGRPGGYGAGGGGAASLAIGLSVQNGNGGPGGFGGGGGGFAFLQEGRIPLPGLPGFGGAFAGDGNHLVGGGGAGLGGCIFVAGGELSLGDGVRFDGCTATRGLGGGGVATSNGKGKGGALFIADGANAHGHAILGNNSASDAAGNGTDTQDIYGTLH